MVEIIVQIFGGQSEFHSERRTRSRSTKSVEFNIFKYLRNLHHRGPVSEPANPWSVRCDGARRKDSPFGDGPLAPPVRFLTALRPLHDDHDPPFPSGDRSPSSGESHSSAKSVFERVTGTAIFDLAIPLQL